MKHLLSSSAYLVVNKQLARQVGLKAVVLLADLISKENYFLINGTLKEGWFFNTSKNIERDTTLTNYQQKKAIKKLEEIGFLETELKGMPATLHFKILENKISTYLNTSFKETSKQDLKKLETNKNKEIIITNNSIYKPIQKREAVFGLEVLKIGEEIEAPYKDKQDFLDYWTEPNPTKTKMRFELQKTFCIKRRLKTWLKRSKQYNNNGTSKIDKQLDSYQKAIQIVKNNYGTE
tara:strand:- start:4644 stop:5348 length:705 start_codon:yes stop_codon:yes gene_type:complete